MHSYGAYQALTTLKREISEHKQFFKAFYCIWIFKNANLHPGSSQDFALQTVQQRQIKLRQDDNQLLKNILRALIQELVSAAVQSGDGIMQYGQSITDGSIRLGFLPADFTEYAMLKVLLRNRLCILQALPLYLDRIFNQFVAIILSLTFVLFFGEVICEAICTRYRLAVGAKFVWPVWILMFISYPISYPFGKVQAMMMTNVLHMMISKSGYFEITEDTLEVNDLVYRHSCVLLSSQGRFLRCGTK